MVDDDLQCAKYNMLVNLEDHCQESMKSTSSTLS